MNRRTFLRAAACAAAATTLPLAQARAAVSWTRSGDTAIIALSGRCTIGEGEVALRHSLQSALEAGCRNVVVDLGRTTFMDSSCLGELISSYTTTVNRGGKLKLANVPAKVCEILQITGLASVLESYGSVQEALAAF
ncbi:MAG: STAS domain-containing protein [Desulfovibrionaceae bacterium]|jgi:anti-sigma B factor antagonist|nr:STAS domain-containing protein [Desulfovibrionaceae bacterium]